ncbi:MAG TPA: efflux RND transporter permease subunit [Candidatus Avibacteroides excrementipullorum]|nr:efflux RND transporter permease subunit [Candidatus Avibacteroides excrementipullorum]
MLNKIIYYSLHNRLIILTASILLMVAGIFVTSRTEVDVFPDLNAPTVVVMTEASGLAAEEVEQLVTFPIETSINGAAGVRRVRSSSTNGFSIVWVEFDWDTDVYLARQIVSERLATVSEELPDNVNRPVMGPQSSILGEVLIIGLTADSTSMMDLRTLADWTIRPRLLSTGGVAQVAVLGGDVKEFQILLDHGKMKHYGVTLQEVMAVTEEMNRNENGGVIYEYGNEYIVRGMLSTTDIEQLSTALVKKVGDMPVLLRDVAEVKIGYQEPKLGTASVRGKNAVLVTVTKQPETNTLELTEKLEAAMKDLQKSMPQDVKVYTDIFKQSNFIENSIGNIKQALYEGAFFVVIVLFLFLANVRTTVISLVTLPLSLLISILVLHLFGLSINTMSLGGMAIAIGSLVDDSIVDVENVYRHIRENMMLPKGERKPVLTVVYDASREVRKPILNSTLIIIASFMPLFFLSGMEGRMLVPLGIAFIVALAASTIVAMTLTPVLCSYLLRNKKEKVMKESLVSLFIKKHYSVLLEKALSHKKVLLGSTTALFIAAIICLCNLGRNFLPPFNEGSFTINISSLPGISLEESDEIGRRAEELLLTVPEIKTVARKTGRAELDEHALGVNTSEIEAPFELKDRSREEVVHEIRTKLSSISGAMVEIGQPISHRIDAMLSGTKASIAIKLFGNDLETMYKLANEIRNNIESVEGIADLNVEQLIDRPQIKITPKREMLARYGISLADFAQFVRVNMAGEVVSQVYTDGKSFDLTVKAKHSEKDKIEKIKGLMIDSSIGKVPLYYVANVTSAMGPNTISRENVKRKIVISANTSGRDVGSVVNDIRDIVNEKITLPEDYHIEYGGQFESEQAASKILVFASAFSLLIIFLLLYMDFKSVKLSAIILINLPLALIGGVFSIYLTEGEMSIPAIIGFISLFGITTRNGMLLITGYQHMQEEGMSLRASIMKSSAERLNPILMTALSSALALIPLAINGDLPGNEIQSPMAKVILGGLITSTILNGFIVPVIYEITNKRKGTVK